MTKFQACLSRTVLAVAMIAMGTSAVAETLSGSWLRYEPNGTAYVNNNHISGGTSAADQFRAGVVFSIPTGLPVSAAELRLASASVVPSPNTLNVYQVTTAGTVLLAAGGGSATFVDLADGPLYGTTSITNGSVITVTLTADAIAAINAAQGGTFAVGLIPVSAPNSYVFGGSSGLDTPRELVLTRGVAPAPIPTLSEWAMILLGIVLAGGAALYIQGRRLAV
ncbi:IPTL-CTERM sorting domain-containing protein [Brevundimonas sp. DC300-4]|uniref:IPTL-CTERM sorting domain-containing protein n=1 Tax=Brevundimonas sp. DC300-4 TaxID=2804594 RepID=UPI003CF23DAD